MSLPTIFLVMVLTFLLIHAAPGDAAWILAGPSAPVEYVETLRHVYGLDQPIHVQLWIYLTKVIHGDLGYSFSTSKPVLDTILERIPATLLLVGVSQVLSTLMGTSLGIYAAKKYRSKTDKLLSSMSTLAYAAPVPWTGLVVSLIFAVTLHWFPATGMQSVSAGEGIVPQIISLMRHMVLPVLTLSTYFLPPFFYVTRASALTVMKEDFVTTARAIGFSENYIFFKYAIRNFIAPTVTLAGFMLGLIFTGAIITETVFAWPGLGSLALSAILNRDYPLVMGIFMITSISVIAANLVVDTLHEKIDPRVTQR